MRTHFVLYSPLIPLTECLQYNLTHKYYYDSRNGKRYQYIREFTTSFGKYIRNIDIFGILKCFTEARVSEVDFEMNKNLSGTMDFLLNELIYLLACFFSTHNRKSIIPSCIIKCETLISMSDFFIETHKLLQIHTFSDILE